LDCLNGHLARSTVLGDYLDHSADILFIIILSIYILTRKYPTKKIICIFVLFYLMLVHMGLQQKNYKLLK